MKNDRNLKTITSLIFLSVLLTSNIFAQQTLEFNSDGIPDNTVDGPSTTIEITFYNDTDNPAANNTFDSYLPTTTATLTITNQQYSTHAQDTNQDNTNFNDPSVILGWEFRADKTSSFNNSTDLINNLQQDGSGIDLYQVLNGISSPSSNNFAASEDNVTTAGVSGEGIEITNNWGAFINTGFYPLKGEPFVDGGGDTLRYHMADLVIDFNNEPVTNPVLHFVGLGGFWTTSFTLGSGPTFDEQYENSATTDFELISPNDGSVSLTKLTGTSNFEVVNDGGFSSIRNTTNVPSNTGAAAAHGSVLVTGEDITQLTFRMYARGTNNPDPKGYGWGGGHTSTTDLASDCTDPNECWYATNLDTGEDEVIDDTNGDPLDYYIAEDAVILSISTLVDPDEVELTVDDCYRMLSAPVDGVSYATLLDPIWTQGVNSTQADYTGGDPNVWLWPDITGESNTGTAGVDTWDPITQSQFENEIPDGTGFLVSVFDDDEFGTTGSWGKILSVTGSENAPLVVNSSNGMNTNNDGWTLLGNPFKSPIQVADGGGNGLFEGSTSGVVESVYIWDRNTESGAGGNDSDSIVGSWRTGTSTGTGDLTDDAIAAFQGFFVQNTSTGGGSSQVDFRDANKTTGGAFYGKEKNLKNIARFEVNGEGLYNSMWLQFSDKGSLDGGITDALELQPMSTEYAMLGTKKADGTIYDIGHYPIPDEEFEIPVSLETTRPGYFTITATDLDLSFGSDLYFIDLQEEESIRIDENFSYQFSTEGVAKTPGGDSFNRCSFNAPQKAKTFAANDRFLIAAQPKEFEEIPTTVALNQNYPNPFNPSTQISYDLPQQTDVQLEVYDLVGRQVATLVNQTMEAGSHTVNFNAGNLSSGVYIYRLNAGNTVLSRKLTIIK